MIFPGAGLVLPSSSLWSHRKRQFPLIDETKEESILNWMISSLHFEFCLRIPLLFLVGIPLLAVLLVLIFVFPIIGGIKANEGIVWKYPLSISFFSVGAPSHPIR